MPLPSAGQISFADINLEMQVDVNFNRSLNDTTTRTLFGVPSGQISMSDGYGKSNEFFTTISSNQTNLDLYSYATAVGYTGGKITVTIAPGVYISATSTANAGLTVSSAFGAGNLTIINNGFIIGKGGQGGTPNSNGGNGNAGGPALSILTAISITNNSYIAGGGGGGAGASNGAQANGGGGAGSGSGGPSPSVSIPGGSGGITLPGTGGSAVSGSGVFAGNNGGSGGSGAMMFLQTTTPTPLLRGVVGGGGGGWGASGGLAQGKVDSVSFDMTSGAGGSAGNVGGDASGGTNVAGVPGAGGNAVALNGFSVTWNAFGTRYGTIS